MNESMNVQRIADAVAVLAGAVATVISEGITERAECARRLADPFVTKQQLAQHFNVTVRTIENWQRRGVLPYVKHGKIVRFKLSEVEAYWSEHFTIRRRGRVW